MEFFVCKKEIKNEMKAIHLGDGDFVCDEKCEEKFNKEKDDFFENINDDAWYTRYMSL